MGGALDSSRFKCYLSKALNANPNEVEGIVIGGHGDTTMIPLTRLATYKGLPVSQLLDAETLEKVAADTMVGGATLTKLLGTSAWYAPGAAAAYVVESILHDQKKIVPCSVYLEGEYGQSDICIGVPVVLGRTGWEKVVDFKLNDAEKRVVRKKCCCRSQDKQCTSRNQSSLKITVFSIIKSLFASCEQAFFVNSRLKSSDKIIYPNLSSLLQPIFSFRYTTQSTAAFNFFRKELPNLTRVKSIQVLNQILNTNNHFSYIKVNGYLYF